jgi:hypothetical protein
MVEAASAVRTRLSTPGTPADKVSKKREAGAPVCKSAYWNGLQKLISGLRLIHTVVTIVFYKATASPTGSTVPQRTKSSN